MLDRLYDELDQLTAKFGVYKVQFENFILLGSFKHPHPPVSTCAESFRQFCRLPCPFACAQRLLSKSHSKSLRVCLSFPSRFQLYNLDYIFLPALTRNKDAVYYIL
jgi:hypothetical protein